MIPGDIGAELATALRTAIAAGELPSGVTELSAAGTWRRTPAGDGGGPGTYASSLPMLIARQASPNRDARAIAAGLARALEPVPWIAAARGSGSGYLTVTVSTDYLARLPARIVAGGQPAISLALPMPDLAAAPNWQRAWNAQHDALVARLTETAATHIYPEHPNNRDRLRAADSLSGQPPPSRDIRPADDGRDRGPVAAAVAWYGIDAVGYALARTARPGPVAIERQLGLPLDLDNPFVLVRYAHAHAASTARWAGELAQAETARPEPVGAETAANEPGGAESDAAESPPEPPPAPEPGELALLDLLSWFPERLAAAARRHRPAELCEHLEQVAGAYLLCAQTCPALPSGGAAAPPDHSGPQAAARLELAEATRAVLGAGLRLAGVSTPVAVSGL